MQHWLYYLPHDEYNSLCSRRAVFRPLEGNMISGALNPSKYLFNASGYIKELQIKKKILTLLYNAT